MENIGAITVFVVLCLIVYFVRKLIYRGVDKATDAVSNAITRKKNTNNPPKTENLADQYKKK